MLKALEDFPPLVQGEIHVWHLVTPASVTDLESLLSEEELVRARQFVFLKDRVQFTSTRAWLRRLIGAYLDLAPGDLRFSYGPQGKPCLLSEDSAESLYFNVSHSRGQALLAFCRNREVGVDTEYAQARFNVQELAKTCFSVDEQRCLASCECDERETTFFRIWTAKEAYVKAHGGGLSIPLQDFTINLRPGFVRWKVSSPGPFFTIQPIDVGQNFASAVAAEGDDWRPRLFHIPAS